MADEQLLILKMLEDGKITAEQATELLTLVGKKPSPTVAAPSPDPRRAQRDLRQEERRALRQQSRSLREEERQVRRQIKHETKRWTNPVEKGSLEQVGHAVQSSLLKLGLPFGGSRGFVFTKELEGEFAGERAEVGVQNTNGQISIHQSQDNKWHLRLTVKVRADEPNAARSLAESLVTVKYADNLLSVESKRLFGQNAVVDVDLQLPRANGLRLQSSCTNGTINLTGVSGERLLLSTVNGKINAEGFGAESIETHSVNGGIWLTGVARKVKCRAANGRIHLQTTSESDAELELETVNGSIEAILPVGEQLGYRVDAASTAGAVTVSLPDVLKDESTRPGRRRVHAESRRSKSRSMMQVVQAKSVSGRITIHTEGGVRKNV